MAFLQLLQELEHEFADVFLVADGELLTDPVDKLAQQPRWIDAAPLCEEAVGEEVSQLRGELHTVLLAALTLCVRNGPRAFLLVCYLCPLWIGSRNRQVYYLVRASFTLSRQLL